VSLDPVSVALQFGFLAVLYLFLLWVARSAMRDLRRSDHRGGVAAAASPGVPADATGLYSASGALDHDGGEPRLVVERAPGHTSGMEYDIGEGAVLGRGDRAEIRLEDPFASGSHARLVRQGGIIVLEDLGSTNGTYLNDELVRGPQPLHAGDRVRIGDSEFVFTDR
jgi:FHA domain